MPDPLDPVEAQRVIEQALYEAEVDGLLRSAGRIDIAKRIARAALAALPAPDAAAEARAVPLWTCPDCAFTMAAEHTDSDTGLPSCPVCEVADLRARLAAAAAVRAEGRRLREACESPANSDPTWITATDVFGKWVWENLDALLADPAPEGLADELRTIANLSPRLPVM